MQKAHGLIGNVLIKFHIRHRMKTENAVLKNIEYTEVLDLVKYDSIMKTEKARKKWNLSFKVENSGISWKNEVYDNQKEKKKLQSVI